MNNDIKVLVESFFDNIENDIYSDESTIDIITNNVYKDELKDLVKQLHRKVHGADHTEYIYDNFTIDILNRYKLYIKYITEFYNLYKIKTFKIVLKEESRYHYDIIVLGEIITLFIIDNKVIISYHNYSRNNEIDLNILSYIIMSCPEELKINAMLNNTSNYINFTINNCNITCMQFLNCKKVLPEFWENLNTQKKINSYKITLDCRCVDHNIVYQVLNKIKSSYFNKIEIINWQSFTNNLYNRQDKLTNAFIEWSIKNNNQLFNIDNVLIAVRYDLTAFKFIRNKFIYDYIIENYGFVNNINITTQHMYKKNNELIAKITCSFIPGHKEDHIEIELNMFIDEYGQCEIRKF